MTERLFVQFMYYFSLSQMDIEVSTYLSMMQFMQLHLRCNFLYVLCHYMTERLFVQFMHYFSLSQMDIEVSTYLSMMQFMQLHLRCNFYMIKCFCSQNFNLYLYQSSQLHKLRPLELNSTTLVEFLQFSIFLQTT